VDRGRVAQYERGDKIRREPWNHYDEQSEAYLHYVLARAGKGRKARILALIDRTPAAARGEQAEDRHLLEAALFLAGDRRFDKTCGRSTPRRSPTIGSTAGASTPTAGAAASRSAVFFDLFGNDPAGEPLATRVAESLTGQMPYYFNTQELVWGVTGLGKWVTGLGAKGTAGGTLTADGAAIAPRAPKHKTTDKRGRCGGPASTSSSRSTSPRRRPAPGW